MTICQRRFGESLLMMAVVLAGDGWLGPRQSDTRWSKRYESDKSLSRLGRITVEKLLDGVRGEAELFVHC